MRSSFTRPLYRNGAGARAPLAAPGSAAGARRGGRRRPRRRAPPPTVTICARRPRPSSCVEAVPDCCGDSGGHGGGDDDPRVRVEERAPVHPPDPPPEDDDEGRRCRPCSRTRWRAGSPRRRSGRKPRRAPRSRPRLPSAIAVGTQGDCRLKNARLSISIVPLNVRPRVNAANAPATTCGLVRGEGAALVDEPNDRDRENGGDRARREKQEADLAEPHRDGLAEAVDVAARREPRESREEHRGDRDREHSLRQHVDPKRGVDRARRDVRVDQLGGEDRRRSARSR